MWCVGGATHIVQSSEGRGERVVRLRKTNGSTTAGEGAPFNWWVAVNKSLQEKGQLLVRLPCKSLTLHSLLSTNSVRSTFWEVKFNQAITFYFPNCVLQYKTVWFSQIYPHHLLDSPKADCCSWAYRLINTNTQVETHRGSEDRNGDRSTKMI